MRWRKFEDVVLIGVLLVLGWQALGFVLRAVLGHWFRANEDFCVNVWLVLPFLAFRLKDSSWRAKLKLSVPKMKVVRDALLVVSATISVGFLIHHDAAHPSNWLESLETWGLNWIYLAAWFFVPWLTWFGGNQALIQSRIEAAESHVMDG